jgi:uroporphyrinogen decarboxylase
MERTDNCLVKLERMNKALHHEEPDRVPIRDDFWAKFIDNWREVFGLPADADICKYYDFDYIVTLPNSDPKIRKFEIIKTNEEETILKTGFGATIQKKVAYQMPAWLEFETDTIDKMKAFEFDDPWDDRRYFSGGDHQIAGIEEDFTQDIPAWIDTVKELYPEFPLYGSVCEAYEMLWRIIGSDNALLWIGLYPDEVGRFVERINEFALELLKAQIKAADGMLDGAIIWGDVAYTRGMLFAPDYWRKHFKPGVKAMIDLCHDHNIPCIYHGCGNVQAIFEDFIEMGADAYNPLEAKAGFDVLELRRQYGHQIAFSGNMDVIAWADADMDELEKIVLTKLNAAKGGGWIFQSDNAVPDTVTPERYEYVINLVRKYSKSPINLGEYDIPDLC